jgi:hypothetical protein
MKRRIDTESALLINKKVKLNNNLDFNQNEWISASKTRNYASF